MYTSYRMLVVLALGLCASTIASAEGWSGKLGLGAIATSGNSETSTFNFDFGLGFDRGVSHSTFTASALQARSEVTDSNGTKAKQTTTERYASSLRSALDFTEVDYVFGEISYEKDLFGGVRERITETLGYGRRILHSPAHQLDLELGIGARQLTVQGAGAQRESDAVASAGMLYVWQLSESSRFSQRLSVESGQENTTTESISELKLAVIGGVFANLGYQIKNNSKVPAGTQRTDTISSVSLSYEF